jgi:hypothetical protein
MIGHHGSALVTDVSVAMPLLTLLVIVALLYRVWRETETADLRPSRNEALSD